jgi:hypothetical protein
VSHSVYCYAEYHYAEAHYADYLYAEAHYAEAHYAGCHYAECLGTIKMTLLFQLTTFALSGEELLCVFINKVIVCSSEKISLKKILF